MLLNDRLGQQTRIDFTDVRDESAVSPKRVPVSAAAGCRRHRRRRALKLGCCRCVTRGSGSALACCFWSLASSAALADAAGVAVPTSSDKIIHLLAFMYPHGLVLGRLRVAWRRAMVVALAAYGVLIELAAELDAGPRWRIPTTCVADVRGHAAGLAPGCRGLRRWCERLESWLVRAEPSRHD